MRAKLILSVVAGLLLGGSGGHRHLPRGARDDCSRSRARRTSGKALIGGPFTLTDQSGKQVTDKDYRGRYMLVFFGFTALPRHLPRRPAAHLRGAR